MEVHQVSLSVCLLKFTPFSVSKRHSRTINVLPLINCIMTRVTITVLIHTFSICINSSLCLAKYNREISKPTSGR